MYEHRGQPLLSTKAFRRRLLRHFGVGLLILVGSLALGMAGYAYFERLGWLDSFLSAAMLLGGMGPVDPPKSAGGKIFAGVYALYAGLAFIVFAGLLVAPFLHRLLHKFHWESEGS